MRIRRIAIENMRSIACADVAVPSGVTLITGENGSGKSTLADLSLAWGIWGETRSASQRSLVRQGQRNMSVAVTFSADGHEYLVRRKLHLRPHAGTDSDLDFLRDGVSLKAPIIAETQARIEAVIGPFALWSQTARVRQQGGAGEFLESVPARRRELLRQIIVNDSQWDGWAKAASTRLREHEAAAQVVVALMAVAEEEGAQADGLRMEYAAAVSGAVHASRLLEEARGALRQAEADVASAQEASRRVALATQTRAALTRAVEDAGARWSLAHRKVESAEELMGLADSTRKRLFSLHEAQDKDATALKQYHEARLAVEQERARLAGETAEAERTLVEAQRHLDARLAEDRRLRELTAEYDAITADVCPTCGQPLNTPEAQARVEQKRQQINAAIQELDPFGVGFALIIRIDKDAVLRAAGALAALQERRPPEEPARPEPLDTSDLAGLTGRLALIEAAERDLPGLRAEVESARVNLDDRTKALEDLGPVPQVDTEEARKARTRVMILGNGVEDAEADATSQQAEATRLAERLRRAAEQVAAVPVLRAKLKESEGHAQTWRILTEACGPAGVRQLMIDQGLLQLETSANRWLELLSPEFHIAFSTLSDTGRETLEEGVQGPFGLLSFADLSGAQSVAVGLAVRLALAELGGVAHGVRHATFVLDEADAWLVGEKQDAYLRLLRTLADSGFDVLCISHISSVKEQVDQVIELVVTAQGTEVRTT